MKTKHLVFCFLSACLLTDFRLSAREVIIKERAPEYSLTVPDDWEEQDGGFYGRPGPAGKRLKIVIGVTRDDLSKFEHKYLKNIAIIAKGAQLLSISKFKTSSGQQGMRAVVQFQDKRNEVDQMGRTIFYRIESTGERQFPIHEVTFTNTVASDDEACDAIMKSYRNLDEGK